MAIVMANDGRRTEDPETTMSDSGASFETDPHRDEQHECDDRIDRDEIDVRAEEALRAAVQDPAVEEPLATPDGAPSAADLTGPEGDDDEQAASRDDEE
jgi:hypothetical protein